MLYIASDHRGFEMKKYLNAYLHSQLKVECEDLGAHTYDATDDAPDFAAAVGKKISKKPTNFGILICWTGYSMCIAANKLKGVRAIAGYNIEGAEMGRKHNDANVLCLASKYLTDEHAAAIVKKFLETKFDGDKRLVRRNEKIAALEK
ncbi:MAG: hypothetical protein A2261_00020 [Candidatus Magasanikbacteria bacterium RIFOXYA2_FULL_44_8]|uniref:Ribose-5-phosphate isomerase n=1 Tax=Candidatus Magasanikbacteria bacterium RIFOXYA2_FULL_44_8 TaxID=1798696 RepID=A0A1F6NLE5_9BACT|nr:MAG: hypothetical protein A2261_00020 [Candidatus Magasanikbacteria bacterium RIFOXYA2_FULL_44_8]